MRVKVKGDFITAKRNLHSTTTGPPLGHLLELRHRFVVLRLATASGRREPLPAVSPEDNTYEVDTILASRETKGGRKEYLVHWKGYLYEEATWEPERNLEGSADLLRKFHAKQSKREPESDSIMDTIGKHSYDSDESDDTTQQPAKKRRQKK